MLEKLEAIKQRFDTVAEMLTQPDCMADMKRFTQLNREYKDLEKIVEKYYEYKNLIGNIETSKKILTTEKDEELREMAKMELDELTVKQSPIEEEIKLMLIPEDPQDSKNAIIEIRSGAGGDEASLFAGDLFRMYSRYVDTRNWKLEVMESNPGSAGGYNKIIFNVIGDHAYGVLKYESGVHRVQRVPDTETQGRVHTSAASMVVLPEADDIDIDLKESDVRIDTFCSSGPGGQSVNTNLFCCEINTYTNRNCRSMSG